MKCTQINLNLEMVIIIMLREREFEENKKKGPTVISFFSHHFYVYHSMNEIIVTKLN